MPNNVWSEGTVWGEPPAIVVIPVVIPRFHLVGMTTLWRVAVWFAYPFIWHKAIRHSSSAVLALQLLPPSVKRTCARKTCKAHVVCGSSHALPLTTYLLRSLDAHYSGASVKPRHLHDQPNSTANLRTKILDFRGFDSSRMLTLRGGILRPTGDFPESWS